MDKQVGFYGKMLENGRKELLEAIGDLTQEELHFSAGGKVNSIAMILKHCAGAEKLLIAQMAGGRVVQRDRAEEFADNRVTLSDILARLSESRALALEVLATLPDAALTEEKVITLSSGKAMTITPEWAIVHSLEHESHHKGQVVMLKRLARA